MAASQYYYTLSKDINLERLLLNEDWVEQKVQEGLMPSAWKGLILQLKNCLQEILEEDEWDLQIYIKDALVTSVQKVNWINIPYIEKKEIWKMEVHCIMRMKEFTIKNRFNRTHLIRELLVKIPITYDYISEVFKVENPEGTRTVFTTHEIYNKYIHSHLPKGFSPDDFPSITGTDFRNPYKKFCLGRGEILDLISDLEQSDFDCETFQLLIYHIQTMVKWESLEGTPHIKMSVTEQIATQSLYKSLFRTTSSLIEDFRKYLDLVFQQTTPPNFDFSFNIFDKKFYIEDIGENENYLLIYPNFEDYKSGLVCYYVNSEYVLPNRQSQSHSDWKKVVFGQCTDTLEEINSQTHLIFQGNFVAMQQIDTIGANEESPTSDSVTPKIILNPYLLDYATEYINNKINDKITRESAFDNCSASPYVL